MSVIQILLVGIALATAGVDGVLSGQGTYKVYVDWVGCPSLLFVDTYPWDGFFLSFFPCIFFFFLYIHVCIVFTQSHIS